MANTTIYSGNTGSAIQCATDTCGSDIVQVVKIDVGAAGIESGPVSATNPMPVTSPVPTIGTSSAYAHTASTTAYVAGQLWANNATAGSVTFGTVTLAKANNQAFTITGGQLVKSGTSVTSCVMRVYLFNAAPTTAVADYGTFAGNLTLVNCIGSYDVTINQQGSDIAYGMLSPTTNSIVCTAPVSGAKTIYFAIVVESAYTPTSAETLTLTLWAQ